PFGARSTLILRALVVQLMLLPKFWLESDRRSRVPPPLTVIRLPLPPKLPLVAPLPTVPRSSPLPLKSRPPLNVLAPVSAQFDELATVRPSVMLFGLLTPILPAK